MDRVTAAERRWVIVFAAVVMAATTVPYLLGYAVQGTDWRFTGFVISVQDGNAFLAKMLFGESGDWLFRTPYTAFPQNGFLIFLPYLLLGKLAAPPAMHDQLIALYHLFRIAAGMLAIVASYDFIAFFLTSIPYRRLGAALVALGGGLGWLLVVFHQTSWLGSWPLDFYSPESFGFLGLWVYPHYALARALLLWGLLAYLQAVMQLEQIESLWKTGLRVGVLWLLTCLAQPLTGMVCCLVGLIFLAGSALRIAMNKNRNAKTMADFRSMVVLTAWTGALPGAFLLYNLAASQWDPFLRLWTQQSIFNSPPPAHYLLAYALVLPLAVVGGLRLWHRDDRTAWMPAAWAVALPLLAYAPVGIQRRLPEGIWVALVVLAMAGLEAIGPVWRKVAGAALVPVFFTAIFLLAGGSMVALQLEPPAFVPVDATKAFQFLTDQAGKKSIVLASFQTGNELPAWAPDYVLVGHGPESVELADLLPRVEAFYRTETPAETRQDLLREWKVDYVFWGPDERALGSWDPRTEPGLTPVYQDNGYWIFRVAEKEPA